MQNEENHVYVDFFQLVFRFVALTFEEATAGQLLSAVCPP